MRELNSFEFAVVAGGEGDGGSCSGDGGSCSDGGDDSGGYGGGGNDYGYDYDSLYATDVQVAWDWADPFRWLTGVVNEYFPHTIPKGNGIQDGAVRGYYNDGTGPILC